MSNSLTLPLNAYTVLLLDRAIGKPYTFVVLQTSKTGSLHENRKLWSYESTRLRERWVTIVYGCSCTKKDFRRECYIILIHTINVFFKHTYNKCYITFKIFLTI